MALRLDVMFLWIVKDKDGTPIGQFSDAQEQRVSTPWGGGMGTGQVKLRLDPRWLPVLTDRTSTYYVECWDLIGDDALLILSSVIRNQQGTSEQGGNILVNMFDAWWYANHRFATNETGDGTKIKGISQDEQDRIAIARSFITAANNIGDTGIRLPSSPPTTGVVALGGVSFTYMAEAVKALSLSPTGFEYILAPLPIEPDGTGVCMGTFVAAPEIGTDRTGAGAATPVIFEYGVGKNNLDSYGWRFDHESQANKLYHATDQDPNNREISDQEGSLFDDHRVLETRVDGLDTRDLEMREGVLAAHKRARKLPRVVWTIKPGVEDSTVPHRVPRPWWDYDRGDKVICRIVVRVPKGDGTFEDKTLVNGIVRIFGITVSVDANGTRSVELQVAEDE